MVYNATTQSDWNKIVSQCNTSPFVWGAIGIHPWYIHTVSDDWVHQMVETLGQNPTLMLGEVGLDKHHPNMDGQIAIFERQLDIAADMQRVVHIHCVGAWDKMLHIFSVRKNKLPPKMVIHGFAGPVTIIPDLVNQYNAYISYGAAIRVRTTPKITDCIRNTPKTRILVESDDAPNDILPVLVDIISDIIGVNMTHQIYQNTQQAITNG